MKKTLGRVFLSFVFFCGCGTGNVLKPQAPVDNLALAANDMEAGRYVSAQSRLGLVLAATPDNYPARSLLAAAYAAQAGVTILKLVQNAASLSSSPSATSSTGLTGVKAVEAKVLGPLATLLPPASRANVSLMGLAVANMRLIPAASLGADMKFQQGLFLCLYALLNLKFLIENPATLTDPNGTAATNLIHVLTEASALLGPSNPVGNATSKLLTDFTKQPGATDNAKLQGLLASKAAG